jgi:hypothetical protein
VLHVSHFVATREPPSTLLRAGQTPARRLATRAAKTRKKEKMNKALLKLAALASLGLDARANDLWEWAPGHYSYTDRYGNTTNGWQWAPGHTTWTDNYRHSREFWEWAPGHWSVQDR